MEFSERFKRGVIDKEISLVKVLNRVTDHHYEIDRTCYCPFHENYDTKSAKVYADERGETLFCFSEQRSFRASDAVTQFTRISIDSLFDKVWKNLSDTDKDFYINNIENQIDVIDEGFRNLCYSLKGFREGKISYKEYLKILRQEVEKYNG